MDSDLHAMTGSRRTEGLIDLAAGLAAFVFICLWTVASVLLIQSPSVWLELREYSIHLALNMACMFLLAYHAGKLHGGLDEKLTQAFNAAILVFGIFALLVLGGRLFFSRPMLIASAAGGVAVGALVVFIRHRFAGRRVATIVPLLGGMPYSEALGQPIYDPSVDLRKYDIVLVSLSNEMSAEWSKAISRAMLAGCKIRHVGEYIEEMRGVVSIDHFEIDHLPSDVLASYNALKRTMDIVLVIFFLPVALPVIAIAIVLIACTMGRPVFFRQQRVGLGNKPFTIFKLRTMRPEQPGEKLVAAVVGDPRITRIGHAMRRLRIDELPQLLNVVRGDMSLIGPRPEAVVLHEEYVARLPNYAYRYLVRPGITGWAQVSAPPSVNSEEARYKLSFDLYYIKKLSIYLDLLILVRTFWTIAAGGGVR